MFECGVLVATHLCVLGEGGGHPGPCGGLSVVYLWPHMCVCQSWVGGHPGLRRSLSVVYLWPHMCCGTPCVLV